MLTDSLRLAYSLELFGLIVISTNAICRVYDTITPKISLSGPTNFAPLIYQAIEICEKVQDVRLFPSAFHFACFIFSFRVYVHF